MRLIGMGRPETFSIDAISSLTDLAGCCSGTTRTMVDSAISGHIVLTVKRFMPTGGVSMPISISITTNTPSVAPIRYWMNVSAIANEIEEPDRARWRFDEAFAALGQALPGLVASITAAMSPFP